VNTNVSPPRLALFLLQTVLFPSGRLPLRIFEPRYLDLVRDCLRDKVGFGVVAIKEGREAGHAATPYTIGTYAEIIDWSQGADGLLNIEIEGSRRFEISSRSVLANQLSIAEVSWLAEPEALAEADKYAHLHRLLQRLYEHERTRESDLVAPECSSLLAYRLAELLPISLARRYELLTMTDDSAQLDLVNVELARLIAAPNK
jgi:uncharacterized protein